MTRKGFSRLGIALSFLVLGGVVAVHAAPTLKAGKVSGQAGAVVDVPISFSAGKTPVASMEFDLTLSPALSTASVVGGEMMAGKSIGTRVMGNRWRFIVFGINQNVIGSSILLTAQVRIAPGTAPGTLKLPLSNIVFADPNGQTVPPDQGIGGMISVVSK